MKFDWKKLSPKDYVVIGFTCVGMIAMIVATSAFLTSENSTAKDRTVLIAQTSTTVDGTRESDAPSSTSTSESSSSDKTSASSSTTTSSSEVYMDATQYRYKYTAVGGETLDVVAEMTDVNVETIAAANNLKESDVLKEGQEIYIP